MRPTSLKAFELNILIAEMQNQNPRRRHAHLTHLTRPNARSAGGPNAHKLSLGRECFFAVLCVSIFLSASTLSAWDFRVDNAMKATGYFNDSALQEAGEFTGLQRAAVFPGSVTT